MAGIANHGACNAAAFANLVLTAEDEPANGTQHTRMNLLHRAGRFQ